MIDAVKEARSADKDLQFLERSLAIVVEGRHSPRVGGMRPTAWEGCRRRAKAMQRSGPTNKKTNRNSWAESSPNVSREVGKYREQADRALVIVLSSRRILRLQNGFKYSVFDLVSTTLWPQHYYWLRRLPKQTLRSVTCAFH